MVPARAVYPTGLPSMVIVCWVVETFSTGTTPAEAESDAPLSRSAAGRGPWGCWGAAGPAGRDEGGGAGGGGAAGGRAERNERAVPRNSKRVRMAGTP